MGQKLLISFFDNDAWSDEESSGKERTPFLVFYQQWGGFSVSAMRHAVKFQHLIDKNKKELIKILNKPNHQALLTDKMVELIHGKKEVWLPWCGAEIGIYGYASDDDTGTREERNKLTKLVLLGNELYHSASLIHNKETYWDKVTGVLGVTPATIEWFMDCTITDGDMVEIQIGIDSDTTCWTIFGAMRLNKVDLTPEEKKSLEDEGVIWVDSVIKYTEEMSRELFAEFSDIIRKADAEGISNIVSEKEKLKITLL